MAGGSEGGPGGVWAPGSADGAVPTKGIGVDVNQAFSVDVVFGLGYALVTEHPLVFLGAGGVMALLQLLVQVVQQGSSLFQAESDPITSAAISFLGMGLSFVNLFVVYWLTSGLMGQAEVAARGGTPTIGGLLRAPRVVNAILAGMLCGILVTVPALILMAPGIGALIWGIASGMTGGNAGYGAAAAALGGAWAIGVFLLVWIVGLFSMLVLPASVLSGGGPLDAVSAAWDAASGARITLFVLALVTALASFFGMLCCFVPLAGVMAVSNSGMALSWLLYARPREETSTWPFFRQHAAHLLL